MPNIEDRFPDNVAGSFYVTDDCIHCHICEERAPLSFRSSEDGDHNIVFHQPSTTEETEAALEALEECPVEAIGREE